MGSQHLADGVHCLLCAALLNVADNCIRDDAGIDEVSETRSYDSIPAPANRSVYLIDNEPGPTRRIGKLRRPQHVGRGRVELAVDVIQRVWRSFVAERCANRLATDHPLKAHLLHQPFDCAAGDVEPFICT